MQPQPFTIVIAEDPRTSPFIKANRDHPRVYHTNDPKAVAWVFMGSEEIVAASTNECPSPLIESCFKNLEEIQAPKNGQRISQRGAYKPNRIGIMNEKTKRQWGYFSRASDAR